MEWPECDFGLLCKCNSRAGHYSGVKRLDDMGVEAKAVKQLKDYSESEDNEYRYWMMLN